ncbi:MAG: acetyl-CoA carboxylase biotin carboxyl carrier protein [Gemmatimonadaceae bacterium]|nr:acetyl-CoA carboxylase biotin carboxyl carrier protein [Gemmatimonadaceae bacterium]
MIDLRYVKKLVDMLDGSSVDSIEISSDKGMKIRISKTPSARGAMHAVAPVVHAPPPAPALTAPAAALPVAAASAAPRAEPASKLTEVKSPMVGTFYSKPEPGAQPYVHVGSQVAKGQVLCIIEAMKIMNEIECEVAGTIREICVTDAHPVEFGQPLFRIDPNG